MLNYAVIENEKVINIVVAEADYAATQGWVELPAGMGIGWTFDGTTWTAPPAPPVPLPPPVPTKEELLAQLQALQAQIAALP